MDDKFSEYLLNIKRQLGPLDIFKKFKTMIILFCKNLPYFGVRICL